MSIKFYDYQWPDCYAELITYYPRFYREVLEMVAILHAEGHLADMVQDDIERAYQNSFIDNMDEETLARLELFLQIGLHRERTLEERRRLVKSFFVGFGKVSASMLKEMIKSYTGADVDIVFEPSDEKRNNTLYIYIQRGDVDTLYMSDISLLLGKKIPAHINWIAAVVYRYAVVVGTKRSHYKFAYDLTGTKPDITTHGDLNLAEVAVEAARRNKVTGYRQAQERGELAGVSPEISTHGQRHEAGVAISSEEESTAYGFRQTKETGELTGVTPDISLHGQRRQTGTAVRASEDSATFGYRQTGTVPDIAAHGLRRDIDAGVSSSEEHNIYNLKQAGTSPDAAMLGEHQSGITAQADVKATSYGADYKFCGTTVAHN